jgi:glycosyltransferase involved in cell wall biosynthesis
MTPKISVIIPTFARPAQLAECLDALAAMDTGGIAVEVIVVNDGSPESLAALIDARRSRLDLRLVEQQRVGPGGARNAGAAVARGRFVAFLDDDCRPSRGWLRVLVEELDAHPDALLGGRVENALAANAYSAASEWIGQFVYDYNRTAAAHEPFFTTNNIALALDRFRDIGGFTMAIPSATAEDKDFCDRWRARGLVLRPVPAAVVHHAHHLTFRRFVRQHFNYGRGILAFRLLRRERANGIPQSSSLPRSGSAHLVPEPVRFYLDLVLSPLRRSAPRPWRLVGLLVVSQVATIAGAVRELSHWRALARARTSERVARV